MKGSVELYLVVSDPVAGYVACTEAAVKAELPYVQLRMKDAPLEAVIRVGREMRAVTRGSKTKFIVNDDLAVAQAVDADGLHVGQSDMPIPDARRTWGDSGQRVFGLSTHDETQARAALDESPDYIGVGPIFATPTKRIPDPVLSIPRAARIVQGLPIPAFGIGGIDRDRMKALVLAGIFRAAVVRYVCQRARPLDAICELLAAGEEALGRLPSGSWPAHLIREPSAF